LTGPTDPETQAAGANAGSLFVSSDRTIRAYRPCDLPNLYRICLATGAAGSDASQYYRDPLLVGLVYAAPYAVLEPGSCLVAEDANGVCGYIVGTADTATFERRLEDTWWPALREAYPAASAVERSSTFDRLMVRLIHRPFRTPEHISKSYPSHLHINLLAHAHGRRVGKGLLDAWLARMRAIGSPGSHLAVGETNSRAVEFYRRSGLREIERTGRDRNIIWFATNL
jgi:ribosomal protein S18 acetylase RimI-like enzyme